MSCYRALASLRLAVFVLTSLIVVLAFATLVESRYGTPAVQFGVYGTWWFLTLGLLLAVNVAAAALIRFPWQRHQTGFVVVHTGILVLLAGCWLSFEFGQNAHLSVFEGRASSRAFQPAHLIRLDARSVGDTQRTAPEPAAVQIPFRSGPFNWDDYSSLSWFPWSLAVRDRGVIHDRDGIRVEVLDYLADSKREPVPRLALLATRPGIDAMRSPAQRLSLTINAPPAGHAMVSRAGIGERLATQSEARVAFWMSLSAEETAAFSKAGPEGPLGRLGQIVLVHRGQAYRFPVADLQQEPEQKLGDSGLTIVLSEFDPRILGVHLVVRKEGETPREMTLYASLPHFNRDDEDNGVYGAYWFDPAAADGEPAGLIDAKALADAAYPRVELLLGHDEKLYYRTFRAPHFETARPWPATTGGLLGSEIVAFPDHPSAVRLEVDELVARPEPGWEVVAKPFHRGDDEKKQPRAKLRITVDDNEEVFWLAAPSIQPSDDQEHVVASERRVFAVSMPQQSIDLGFEVFLHRFERKLDPGSGMPSHYASLVDFREAAAPDDAGAAPRVLRREVLIPLNHPMDIVDPSTGRTYRLFQASFEGPWSPGSDVYQQFVGSHGTREQLYRSVFSVNYDPGRGLKYAGGLLIVLGIAIFYYMKAYFFKPRRAAQPRTNPSAAVEPTTAIAAEPSGGQGSPLVRALLAVVVGLGSLAVPGAASAADEDGLDWEAWQTLPVFYGGRKMPLDTFARATVLAVCGRERPTLAPPEEGGRRDQHAVLFPGGKPRKFEAAELLFSWLVEPQRWRGVPFLVAEHKELRSQIMGLPLRDAQGNRLRYVTPEQVESNAGLHRRWQEMQQRQHEQGEQFEARGAERKVEALLEAYGRFRELTDDPAEQGEIARRFRERLASAAETWGKISSELRRDGRLSADDATGKLVLEVRDPLLAVVNVAHGGAFDRAQIEESVAALREVTRALEDRCQKAESVALATLASELDRDVSETHLALYEGQLAVRIVPALNPDALDARRLPEHDLQPWLALRTVLLGSDQLLADYPSEPLDAARKAFDEVRGIYLDRDRSGRAEAFAPAMQRFAAAVRELSEAVMVARDDLPIRNRDETLMMATAYPAPGALQPEIIYNRLDPFLWSWVLGLGALACLSLSIGVVRQPMFWSGALLLTAAMLMTLTGLGFRYVITGLVPLTGMFETVVFVAACVTLMGLAFALTPLFAPGLRAAWKLTGWPQPSAARDKDLPGFPAMQWSLVGLRLVLAVPVAQQVSKYIDVVPKIESGASLPTWNALIVSVVGLGVLIVIAYLVPRIALTVVASLWTVPQAWMREGIGPGIRQVIERRAFLLAGAGASTLAALVAYFAPPTVLQKGISMPMPVLRDNFWLAVHVLTITASYGAGALAWGLGNLSLGYYLFGRYRDATVNAVGPDGTRLAARRLPPEECGLLAQHTYRATQVAVLLLAAGTILGALWADIAWGRFWSWDAKEVWALISLLVYMVILHGRHVGWFGDFGLALSSVLGATAIIFAWYGVNFVLPGGLHSYGRGAGGQLEVGLAVLANYLFLVAAAARYNQEIHRKGASIPAAE
ncbi:MAG: cytochrome c biogenesis protein CcsA [Planctomycetota bacterium]